MSNVVEQETRIRVVDGDLDNLYYADEPEEPALPCKKVPTGDIYEAARAGDVERLKILLEQGANVNVRDVWDSVALYYACLAGHLDAARMLMECGAICSENTFDGDRCHYAALNLRVRKLLKVFEARPPPLDPLPRSLRELFLSSKSNLRYSEGLASMATNDVFSDHIARHSNGAFGDSFGADFRGISPDISFFVQGQPIEAHRAILVGRSPYFRAKFEKDWKHKREVRFSSPKLTFSALFSLIQFFYTDRLDVAVEDMQDLARICKVCGCIGLQRAVEKELLHQKFAEYKHLRDADDSQKRFILQGSFLPENERLPFAMCNLLNLSLRKSRKASVINGEQFCSMINVKTCRVSEAIIGKAEAYIATYNTDESGSLGGPQGLPENKESTPSTRCREDFEDVAYPADVDDTQDDHADVCFMVNREVFRSHQVILAARSDYFRTRFSRMKGFRESKLETVDTDSGPLPVLQEQDLSSETFEKLLEYMYTDQVSRLDPHQAEELFDAASRYLLFPLKKIVADALLPHLETVTPGELCQWLLLGDMYGVWKLREYCLDTIAVNFEVFSKTREFRKMLSRLPPPSGDSSQRTSAPSAPGGEGKLGQGNLLDDLREKWLEAEGAELDKRDESAIQFDKLLEMLVLDADEGACEDESSLDVVAQSEGVASFGSAVSKLDVSS